MAHPASKSKLMVRLVLVVITLASFFGLPGAVLSDESLDESNMPEQVAIQYLMQHRSKIERSWSPTELGIASETTSSDPEVASMIQRHVREMKDLVGGGGTIRTCDPLFAALEARHEDVELINTNITNGVSVQTSATNNDACLAETIQAHAAVVSLFISEGPSQTRQCFPHEPPACAADTLQALPEVFTSAKGQQNNNGSSTTTPQDEDFDNITAFLASGTSPSTYYSILSSFACLLLLCVVMP